MNRHTIILRLGGPALALFVSACPGWWRPEGTEMTANASTSGAADTSVTDDAVTDGDTGPGGDLPPPFDPAPVRPDLDARRPCSLYDPVFVDPGGACDGHAPCFVKIQPAVDASVEGGTVWVFPGTYRRGGSEYVIDATAVTLCIRSVEGPAATVLDGEEAGTVVVGGYDGPLWLEGFTIRNAGLADDALITDGFGVSINGWDGARGAVVDNVFERNWWGNGALNFGSDGIDVDIFISGNTFRENRAEYGGIAILDIGGVGDVPGVVRIENNLFFANEGTALAFHQMLYFDLEVEGVPAEVVNNTITGSHIGLAGAFEGLAVHNNIFFDNGTDVARLDEPMNISVGSNLFSDAAEYSGVAGNLVGDPGFVDAAGGDYHLLEGSPARGSADPGRAPVFDLEGSARDLAQPDRGAFESASGP